MDSIWALYKLFYRGASRVLQYNSYCYKGTAIHVDRSLQILVGLLVLSYGTKKSSPNLLIQATIASP